MRRFVLDLTGFDSLLSALSEDGYRTVGPTVSAGAIRMRQIDDRADLPTGSGDRQGPGEYRLAARDDALCFGFAVGPDGLKPMVFPPRRDLWAATVSEDRIRFEPVEADPNPVAVIGARGCDLAALRIHDRVFTHGPYADPDYTLRRRHLFLVAVDCTHPAATCFCTSLGTGPSVGTGFDLALTEVADDNGHRFVGRVGSPAGARVLARLDHRDATSEDLIAADAAMRSASAAMTRRLDARAVPSGLRDAREHHHWQTVAERCLACANCTMVCPTCFCSTTEDGGDLDGITARRSRRWDSCFALDFSLMGGRPERASVKARYRQWLSHKLSTWTEQFGTLGCVGCGRCITWCPVGIDLTEEAARLLTPEPADV